MTILSKGRKPDEFELQTLWNLALPIFEAFVQILLNVNLSWHSCSMWDKLGWLNWFWTFLFEGLSSVNPKRFCYSYAWSCEGRACFCTVLISRKLCGFFFVFDWLYFIRRFTSFSSIYHLLRLYGRFLMLFHPTQTRFSQSAHLLMCLSLTSLTSTIKIGWPILVELIGLVNSVIIFLSQTTLLRWLTFLLGSLTVTLIVLLIWISFIWC